MAAWVARLGWCSPVTWLLRYGGALSLLGCSTHVAFSCDMAAWVARLKWCSPKTWLLLRRGALLVIGCSHKMALLWSGALVSHGCFGTVVLSSLLAARVLWRSPALWLLRGLGTLLIGGSRSGALLSVGCSCHVASVAALAMWRSLSTWLLSLSGALQSGGCSRDMVLSFFSGCSVRVALSSLVATLISWCSFFPWLLRHRGAL